MSIPFWTGNVALKRVFLVFRFSSSQRTFYDAFMILRTAGAAAHRNEGLWRPLADAALFARILHMHPANGVALFSSEWLDSAAAAPSPSPSPSPTPTPTPTPTRGWSCNFETTFFFFFGVDVGASAANFIAPMSS